MIQTWRLVDRCHPQRHHPLIPPGLLIGESAYISSLGTQVSNSLFWLSPLTHKEVLICFSRQLMIRVRGDQSPYLICQPQETPTYQTATRTWLGFICPVHQIDMVKPHCLLSYHYEEGKKILGILAKKKIVCVTCTRSDPHFTPSLSHTTGTTLLLAFTRPSPCPPIPID